MFFNVYRKEVIFCIGVLLAVMAGAANAAIDSIDYCWKTSYGRSAGWVGKQCPPGQHLEGLNCYEDCPEGFESNRMGLCIQTCPGKGWRDEGGFCRKFEYHVSEYPWEFGDKLNLDGATVRCGAAFGKNNCETRGAVVVEKCPWGYEHILGFCRPSGDAYPKCNELGFAGQFDLSCTKDSFFKTPHDTQCKTAESSDDYEKSGLLCYPGCGANAKGDGPICWVNCPAGWVNCGGGCARSDDACANNTQSQVLSVIDFVTSTALLIASGGSSAPLKNLAKELGKSAVEQFTKDAAMTAGNAGGPFIASTYAILSYALAEGEMDPVELEWAITQRSLEIASMIDPTGAVGVAAAYAKPICDVVPGAYPPPPSASLTTGGIAAIVEMPAEKFSGRYTKAVAMAKDRVGTARTQLADAQNNLNYWKFEMTGYNQLKQRKFDLQSELDCVFGCLPKPPCYQRRGEPTGTDRRSGQVQQSDYQRRAPAGQCTESLTPQKYDELLRAKQDGVLWQALGWTKKYLESRKVQAKNLQGQLRGVNEWMAKLEKGDFRNFDYTSSAPRPKQKPKNMRQAPKNFAPYPVHRSSRGEPWGGAKFVYSNESYRLSADKSVESATAKLIEAQRNLQLVQNQARQSLRARAELIDLAARNKRRSPKAIGDNDKIEWKSFENPHGLNQISSGPDALWGRNANNETWKYDYVKRSWTELKGSGSIQLSVEPIGKVWRLDRQKDASNNNHIYFLNTKANKWEKISGGLLRLSAGPNELWGNNTQGDIWRYRNNSWNKIPGDASDVSVDGNGVVWRLSEAMDSRGSYNLYKSNGDRGWKRIATPEAGLKRISAGPNGVWATSLAGEVWLHYQRGSINVWKRMSESSQAVYVNASAKGDVWIIDAKGRIKNWNF